MTAQLQLPLARRTDPPESRDAARSVEPANSLLIQAIRRAVRYSPFTAFEIAEILDEQYPGRWDATTVRTAVSRSGLVKLGVCGVSPRGQRCALYAVEPVVTDLL